jgi:mannose-1-phosphate guanylyltransferase/phosphomannomutase
VPVTLPSVFERLAEQFGGSVVRTKASLQALMEASTADDVVIAGDGYGSFIFPQFQPVVDGLMAIAKLLEFLATQKTTLSAVTAGLPPYHTARRRVSCPWEKKGTVMRLLNEQYKGAKTELVDGIKIHLGEEWVLVLPDPDRPMFHIHSEAGSRTEAEELAGRYVRIVEGLQE